VSCVELALPLARYTEEGWPIVPGLNSPAKKPLQEAKSMRAEAIGVSAACRDGKLVCPDTF
jgi:hypothetical protein